MKLGYFGRWAKVVFGVWLGLVAATLAWPVGATDSVKIAVLAYRPKPQTLAKWQPLAGVLKAAIPDRDFEIVVYNLDELQEAVSRRQVDFVLTNPGHYVLMTRRSGLKAPLATLLVEESGQEVATLGGVMFSRAADRTVQSLADLKGKTVATVGTDSLGGYQMQAYEAMQAGVSLPVNAKLLVVGMPQDKVVTAVLQGRADVGLVRTGLLEALQREGQLDMRQVRVIHRQRLPAFPVQSSTPLYPEWSFSYLGHVDEHLARRVTAALFSIRPDSTEARAMGIRGFSVPADYTPVADVLRTLRLPPFDLSPTFTLGDVAERYRTPLLLSLLGLMLVVILSARLWLAQRLLRAEVASRQASELTTERSRQLLKTVIDNVPFGVFWKGLDHRFMGGNSRFAKDSGLASSQEVEGKDDFDVTERDRAKAFRRDDLLIMESGHPKLFFEDKFVNRHGQQRWNRVSKVPLRAADGAVFGVLGIYEDVSAQKRIEEQLVLDASVFEHAREGIAITDVAGNIINVNAAFTTITGYSREEVLGKNTRLLNSGRHGPEFFQAMYVELQDKGYWHGEIWNRRKNGELYAELLTITVVRDAQSQVQHYIAMFFDISDIKKQQQQLEHIAHFDALTNLPNRVLLADRLQQAMVQAQRRGRWLAVAYLDLDGFKLVNDTYGHDVGDLLLVTISDHMKGTLREGDTLARLGGDEFVAVLADLTDTDDCTRTLNRMLAAVASPVPFADQSLHVSASLGVTFYPQTEAVDADQLLRQADQAMYQAKLLGKNRFHVFDAAHDRSVRGMHESLDEIARAIELRQFVLYYQPKVNMRTGQVLGAEALIRWQHPERGLLPPAQFLPLIEDHPLAVTLGEWVIGAALQQMQQWHALGLALQVSVNLSARQLQQDDFVQRVGELLASAPTVNPALLQMEVLETSALQDLARTSQVIHACAQLGVGFALDDFGTAYSSLTYLKHLPVQTIKIDQSFVRNMLGDADDLAILQGVISLARAFKREVIAEGVETVAHGTRLLQLGCDLAQGYGIARPMPADQFCGWMARWQPDAAWAVVAPDSITSPL
ncbi:EAL domain-containing protein [Rhodoferax sp.]|uniref:EAL domain-containing protein n=1 Tax=Rhodoferax sp. TaxID=50421 RepID=UPI00284B7813|nr:EAL domain-containing protein [Rhodoferax sp.]MDR3370407.1 EAL domain-containing protein [Rhodoferax sp.]